MGQGEVDLKIEGGSLRLRSRRSASSYVDRNAPALPDGLSVYSGTKASMLGFTRSLAREVGRMGVNVNAVAPGFLDTEMTEGMRTTNAPRWHAAPLAAVEDVGEVVAFLLSDGARSITGTVLTADASSTA